MISAKKILALAVGLFLFDAGALGGSAFAAAPDGAMLFNQSSFIAKDKEAGALNAAEAKHLASWRAATHHANIKVVPINRAAFDSGVLTLALPDGTQVQYVGSKVQAQVPASQGIMFRWTGASQYGGRFSVSFSDDGLVGQINEGGKHYDLVALPGGKNAMLAEATPSPFSVY